MSVQLVRHRRNFSDALTARDPSPNLWHDCPWNEMASGDVPGIVFFDDFLNFSDHITAQAVQGYYSYIDTNVTILQSAIEDGGVVTVTNAAENDEGHIATHGPQLQISDTAGDDKKTWFECRVKKANITDDAGMFFVGLAGDAGVSKAVENALVDDTGVVGAFSFLGFSQVAAAGETVNFIYNEDTDSTPTTAVSGAATLAADTWVKLGFKYDPIAPDAKLISVYVNNVESATYVTRANIEATAFPDAERMGLHFLTKISSAAACLTSIDWWRLAQAL